MEDRQLLNEAEQIACEVQAVRRELHCNAEVGFELNKTFDIVFRELERYGYSPCKCGKSGIIATVGNGSKTILLRADMDALPIEEESGEDFACKSGSMHACGHDMHTAMLLGAARLLKMHEAELKGMVKLMFQPAEEIFEGAEDMLKSGLLNNPEVDAAMMIHVMVGVPFETGTVVVSSPGVSAPAADYFEIAVRGKGCHGSMPNMGVDPLNAAAHIIIALQELNARELAMNDRAVLTIGTMRAGNAANAIPDTVVMGGSLRTFDEETRTLMKSRMEEISVFTAKAFRAEAELTFGSGCPTLLNDEKLSLCCEKCLTELLGKNKVFTSAQLTAGSNKSGSAGSEDFAYISQRVPSIMLALSAGDAQSNYPLHHPRVRFDEKALPVGCAVYADVAMRWLTESE